MTRLTERQKQAIGTKLKILEVAFELFRTTGFDLVKVQDICKAADISVGAFYHHFSSKMEIINTGYKQIDMLLEEKYINAEISDPIEKINFLIGEGGILLQNLGWNFVGEVYRNLIITKSKYTFDESRFVFVEIRSAIELAMNNGRMDTNVSSATISSQILRISRGTIFDWCLNEGKYELKDQLLEDIGLILK